LTRRVGRELPVLLVTTGGSLLALWLYVRLGERRPQSLKGAIVHCVIALAALSATPIVMAQLLGTGMSHDQALVGLLGILLPAITYTFLATLYLFEHLQRLLYAR
jgi:hypothetical protein